MEEIKFIALPRWSDLEYQINEHDDERLRLAKARIKAQYQRAQWKIMQAQRKAAVIATEVCRPHEFRSLKNERDAAIRHARERFEDNCVGVFSEQCTRGL